MNFASFFLSHSCERPLRIEFVFSVYYGFVATFFCTLVGILADSATSPPHRCGRLNQVVVVEECRLGDKLHSTK